jgi:hypothetical protein
MIAAPGNREGDETWQLIRLKLESDYLGQRHPLQIGKVQAVRTRTAKAKNVAESTPPELAESLR